MRDVSRKVVLVTGAAMGLGKLLVEKFAEDGARVVMSDINEADLKQSYKEFKEKGYDVHEYICDISDREQVYKMAQWIKKELCPVNVLVNNAGVAFKGTLLDADDEGISKTYDINVKGPIWTMKAFLPDMIEINEGHILNIASASGFIGVPGLAAYASSKWAVIGLSESVRQEVERVAKNIKFTIVCPSYISTGMFEGIKAPLLTKFMSPRRIVDIIYSSFKKDKVYVLEPFMVKVTPTLKAILPTKIFDLVSFTLGISKGQDKFVGRN